MAAPLYTIEVGLHSLTNISRVSNLSGLNLQTHLYQSA